MLDPVRARADARAPGRDRLCALGRRLRHRLLVARQPQAPAGRHDQDRQVVRARHGDEHADAAIVRSTIELAHNLGLRVVAEGVESAARRGGASPRSAATSPRATTSRGRSPRAACWRCSRPSATRRCASSRTDRHATVGPGMDDALRLPTCSIGRAMEILGERWTLLILRECFYGVKRFSVMQRNLGIARNILSVAAAAAGAHRHPRAPPLPGGARALRVQADGEGPRAVSRRRRDHALGRRAPVRRAARRSCCATPAAISPTRCWSAPTAATSSTRTTSRRSRRTPALAER